MSTRCGPQHETLSQGFPFVLDLLTVQKLHSSTTTLHVERWWYKSSKDNLEDGKNSHHETWLEMIAITTLIWCNKKFLYWLSIYFPHSHLHPFLFFMYILSYVLKTFFQAYGYKWAMIWEYICLKWSHIMFIDVRECHQLCRRSMLVVYVCM